MMVGIFYVHSYLYIPRWISTDFNVDIIVSDRQSSQRIGSMRNWPVAFYRIPLQ